MSATRILTVADVHQHRALLAELASAVERVRPAAVVFVGDLLDSNGSAPGMAGLAECAQQVANLATPELIFVRGNHEEGNWPPFASLLRGRGRMIVTLHGECHRFGATGLLGFPCFEGYEDPFLEGREALAADPMEWLPEVMDEHGSQFGLHSERRVGDRGATVPAAPSRQRARPSNSHAHPAVARQAGTDGLREHRPDTQATAALCAD